MATQHNDAFKREAVRIALTSGLTHKQVSSDLGVGLSTLNKWIKTFRDDDAPSLPDNDLVKEVKRLRRENRILKEATGVTHFVPSPIHV